MIITLAGAARERLFSYVPLPSRTNSVPAAQSRHIGADGWSVRAKSVADQAPQAVDVGHPLENNRNSNAIEDQVADLFMRLRSNVHVLYLRLAVGHLRPLPL